SLMLTNPLQASLLHCAVQGILLFSLHTSLDSVWRGMNDWLSKGLGPGQISALVSEKFDTSGTSEGAEGRLVFLDEPVLVKELVDRVKWHLGLSQGEKNFLAYPSAVLSDIRTVAICAGSGGSMLLVGRDADVYFTGEMSHHEVFASVSAGKHVILCE
ncbi:NGG1p interacting factor 3, partial [Guyanagaster necrorhizus]